MRKAVFAFLALCLLPAGAVDASTSGIKGEDDRRYVSADVYPWSAIGRLRKADGSICTGSLVARTVVLTAAHCLWDPAEGTWARESDLAFAVGIGTAEERTSSVVSYEISASYRGSRDLTLTNSAHDWALVHLDQPLGDRTGTLGLLPLDTRTMDRLEREAPLIVQAGYSADLPEDLTAHVGCRLLGWGAPGLVAHDCDAVTGDSGSPVFAWVDDAYRIVAVHVSTFREGLPTIYGGAVPGAVFVPSASRVGATPYGSPN